MANYPTTNIPQMSSGDNIAVHANAMSDQSSPSQIYARNYETSTGLTWGYLGGYFSSNGTLSFVSNGTVSLTGSTTNYIEADATTGAVAVAASRTAGKHLLYSVVTSSTAVTSYVDYRTLKMYGIPYLSISIAGSSDTTLTADQSDPFVEQYILTGALTGNKSVIFPNTYTVRTFVNATTGDYTVTLKAGSGAGVVLPRGEVITVMFNGSNTVVKSAEGIVSGGSVTQLTSKSTGVTLHTGSGQITMHNAALNAATAVSFTLTNNAIGADDHILVHRKSGGTADSYRVWCDAVAAGSCSIRVENTTGGSLSEAVVLGFRVFRGSL